MKKFNIHDWQAKQRLVEQDEFQKRQDALTPGKNKDWYDGLDKLRQSSSESMSNADIAKLQRIVGDYSLNKILNTIAVIADKKGKHDEADDIKKLANDKIQDFLMDMDEMNTTGTGASFNAGTGMGHFGKSKKKRRTNEQEESDNMTDDQLAQWRKDNLEEPEEEPGKEPEKKDAKSISGLADAFRDMSIQLRQGKYKGVQGAEIMEINQLMDLVIKAADQANITTIIQRLEVMVGKTIKNK